MMRNIINSQSFDEIHSFCKVQNIAKYKINTDGSVDVDQDVDLSYQDVEMLPFKFNIINGSFYATDNKLKNLYNFPNIINGNLSLTLNNLTTLEGLPKHIKGELSIDVNTDLDNLYVGDYDVIIGGNIDLNDCAFSYKFLESIELSEEDTNEEDDEVYSLCNYDSEIIRLIFKYQRHYEIWNKNLSLNIENFTELITEIKDGLK